MCRVHTERFHWLCAHYTWITTRENNGECNGCTEQQAYRLEVRYGSLCPTCQALDTDTLPASETPESDGYQIKDRIGDDWEALRRRRGALYRGGVAAEAERKDFDRREDNYIRALGLYRLVWNALERSPTKALVTWLSKWRENWSLRAKLVGIDTKAMPQHTIPLRFPYNKHLLDLTDFSSPLLTVVPPKLVPEEWQKCGICWGNLSLTSVEGCEGGWARVLPCGHIYGKGCLAVTLRHFGNCPLCTRKYRVRSQMHPDPVAMANYGLMAEPNQYIGQRWALAVLDSPFLRSLLFPLALAAVLTMDVGPRLRGDHREANLPTKIVVWLSCILASPLAYAWVLWHIWKGL